MLGFGLLLWGAIVFELLFRSTSLWGDAADMKFIAVIIIIEIELINLVKNTVLTVVTVNDKFC